MASADKARVRTPYETERLAFARKLADTTDRLFTFITSEGNFAGFVRVRIAPLSASVAYGMDTVREFLFRILSQLTIRYHDSPLSVEAVGAGAGNIKAGAMPSPAWRGAGCGGGILSRPGVPALLRLSKTCTGHEIVGDLDINV